MGPCNCLGCSSPPHSSRVCGCTRCGGRAAAVAAASRAPTARQVLAGLQVATAAESAPFPTAPSSSLPGGVPGRLPTQLPPDRVRAGRWVALGCALLVCNFGSKQPPLPLRNTAHLECHLWLASRPVTSPPCAFPHTHISRHPPSSRRGGGGQLDRESGAPADGDGGACRQGAASVPAGQGGRCVRGEGRVWVSRAISQSLNNSCYTCLALGETAHVPRNIAWQLPLQDHPWIPPVPHMHLHITPPDPLLLSTLPRICSVRLHRGLQQARLSLHQVLGHQLLRHHLQARHPPVSRGWVVDEGACPRLVMTAPCGRLAVHLRSPAEAARSARHAQPHSVCSPAAGNKTGTTANNHLHCLVSSPRSDVLLVTYPRFPNKEQVTMPPETPPQIVDVSTGASGSQLAAAGDARGRHSGCQRSHTYQAACQTPQLRPILPAAGTNLGVEDARWASESDPDPHLRAARPTPWNHSKHVDRPSSMRTCAVQR